MTKFVSEVDHNRSSVQMTNRPKRGGMV